MLPSPPPAGAVPSATLAAPSPGPEPPGGAHPDFAAMPVPVTHAPPLHASPPDADALLRLVDEVVRELQPGTTRHASLDSALDRELGLDSLSRVELLARIERRFALRLPTEVLAAADTPRDLLRALAQAARTPAPPSRATGGAADAHTADTDAGAAQAGASEPAPASAAPRFPESAATLVEVLEWHVDRHPGRTHVRFLVDDEHAETLSYGQLHEAAMRLAGALVALGVRPGDCVALMLPSGLDFFRCLFAILFAGAVPVPMYPPARPNQIEEHLRRQAGILRNCEARVLITFERVRPLARMLAGLVPTLAHVGTPAALGAAIETARARPLPPQPLRSAALGLIQYTSGSTGDPKGVALSHANLLANIRAWGRAAAVVPQDVCVSWLPLYHDMGLIGTWLGSLYHGCTLVLMSPLDFLARPERWLWAIHHYRGTVTAAPNFAFELCVKRLADTALDGLDLSSWRLAANGAEPVNPETLARFAAAFARYGLDAHSLMPVYGLAECAVGLCVPPPGRGVVVDRVRRASVRLGARVEPATADEADTLRLVSCGPVLPGHALRVVDGEGHPLPERCVGEVEFRGPSATAGYYRNPAATAALIRDGWLATGDHGYLAEGELYLTGRAKEMIIRAGRNLYPYDLEQAVGELPGVRKGCVAVFGTHAPGEADERLVVVAETRVRDAQTRAALEARITAAAMDELGLAPDVVVLAPPHAVLKTSSGKIRRAAIRDAYLTGTLGAPSRATWLQVLRLQLASLAGRARCAALAVPGQLRAAWAWSAFALLAPLATLAILALPRLGQRWTVCHRLARLHARLCGCALQVQGVERLPASGCVLVANHASYIDGLVLAAALPRPVRFVAKAELRDNRLLRPLFERMGAHFVRRFDAGHGVEDADTLAAGAGTGAPLLFFAEGTFSARPGLQAFRLGAFQAAARQRLAVVPVALAGTRAVLPDGSWRPRPGPLAVTICAPRYPAGEDWHDLLALRDTVRADILAHCGEGDATRD